MNKYRLALLGSLLLVIFLAEGTMALPLQNEDFSGGFAGWTTAGDVSAVDEEAVLGDNGAIYSLLYQGTALAHGNYTIQFDFKHSLFPTTSDADSGSFAFPDTFFASLYMTDNLNDFSLDPQGSGVLGYTAALSLFSLDASGVFDNFGIIGSSQKGLDWQKFTMSFQNDYAYAIPVFELFDMNFIDNDSSVRIDNVSIAANPVPEPATLVMLLGGFAGLIVLRKKIRH